ncbi:hypothetical protein AAG570_005193 [Ranatra chinensis]|uniref:Uncharacterized protein n=1 Tax=Ranatra chinensis TaxID=642074 RepID=A0ABD0XZQ2_9HEMI
MDNKVALRVIFFALLALLGHCCGAPPAKSGRQNRQPQTNYYPSVDQQQQQRLDPPKQQQKFAPEQQQAVGQPQETPFEIPPSPREGFDGMRSGLMAPQIQCPQPYNVPIPYQYSPAYYRYIYQDMNSQLPYGPYNWIPIAPYYNPFFI